MKNIKMNVSADGAEKAAKSLDKLAEAAGRAQEAIKSLEAEAHGGIRIQIVGDICRVDILPSEEG